MVHVLASLTWPDVAGLPHRRAVAVLPAGAIEAHGPHLPLGTDLIIAEAMARRGAERLSARGLHVLLLPTLAFSAAPFAAGFAGTVDAPADATTAQVVAIVRNLSAHGVGVTAIANAHHDPAHVGALRAAVAAVESNGYGTLVFPDLTRKRWAEELTEEFKSGACHAGRYEGSIVLAARPDLVRTEVMSTLAPNPRSLVDALRRQQHTFVDAGGPQAYFGFPAEATADEGRQIVETLGSILERAVMEAFERTGVGA
jgi:creatinine amidohydrolase